jgi:hypothetical protein
MKVGTDISHIQDSVVAVICKTHYILNLNALSTDTVITPFNPRISPAIF